ncbi:unnamed protein product [Brachionus calyciflorus]|uniref:Nuclear receptor domain-containing protein n=1 Tax=Brachionus calyciflorus TaxID=104777 RepID=A0A813QY83_9BILA|nr:unnamed protein product [Brachionus calyciflorus]
MNLVEIKDSFSEYIKQFNREDFDKLMEFCQYIFTEYKRAPAKLYNYLNCPNEEYLNDTDSLIDLDQSHTLIYTEKQINSVLPHEKQINSFLPHEITIEQTKSTDFENLLTDKQNKKLCTVCDKKPIRTYYHGPGVCHACRVFFVYSYLNRDQVKCSMNRLCLRSTSINQCRACRMEKCLNVGMKWRGVGTRYSLKSSNLRKHKTKQAPLDVVIKKCVCCERTENIGHHYDVDLCNTCRSWYGCIRNDSKRRNSLICTQINPDFRNKCHEMDDFVPAKCAKCRLAKILKFI